jgi:hypothetical protein
MGQTVLLRVIAATIGLYLLTGAHPAWTAAPPGGADATRVRVSAQTQSWWLTRRPPVVTEIELPSLRSLS